MDWYRWFPSLYSEATLHLNLEQDAIYRRLIDWYMTSRMPLPCHANALARICQISLDKWQEHSQIVLPFFHKMGDKYHHKRCDIELDRQDGTSKKLSDAAKKAHETRKQNKENQRLISLGNTMVAIEERRGEEKESKGEKNPLPYRFEGRVIKLSELDFKRWETSFKNINLLSELQKRDDWLALNPQKQANWFLSTSSYFAKIDGSRKTKKPTGHRQAGDGHAF